MAGAACLSLDNGRNWIEHEDLRHCADEIMQVWDTIISRADTETCGLVCAFDWYEDEIDFLRAYLRRADRDLVVG